MLFPRLGPRRESWTLTLPSVHPQYLIDPGPTSFTVSLETLNNSPAKQNGFWTVFGATHGFHD